MDQFRTSNPTALTWIEVDSRAHTKEPRHRIAVGPNKQSTVSEWKACTDRGQHETDGDSELKETDPNAPWEAQRAERRAQNERDTAIANQGRIALAHQLAQVDDDTATALRLIAYESLPLPPPTTRCYPSPTPTTPPTSPGRSSGKPSPATTPSGGAATTPTVPRLNTTPAQPSASPRPATPDSDPPGRSRQHQARSPPGGRACSLPYPPATGRGVVPDDTPFTTIWS